MWAALHVVKATVSLVGGSWSDRIGRRTVIAIGWIVYAVVYAGFAMSTSLVPLLAWFLIYGFYFGFAEGTEKALVADLAPASRRGFAFGIYNAVLGIGALLGERPVRRDLERVRRGGRVRHRRRARARRHRAAVRRRAALIQSRRLCMPHGFCDQRRWLSVARASIGAGRRAARRSAR